MAISIIQHVAANSSANTATVAATISATGAGRLLVAVVGNANGQATTGVSDGTNAFAQATGAAGTENVGQNFATDAWYLLSSAAGKTTITATVAAAGTFNKEIVVYEVLGVGSWSFDIANNVTNGNGGADGTMTGPSITTTTASGFAAGIIVTQGGITQNPKTGNEFNAGGDITATSDAAASLIYSTAAAHQPVWLDGNLLQVFCSSVAAFKDGGGGGGGSGKPALYYLGMMKGRR